MNKTIFEEAEEIINGERREAYGPVDLSFQRIATGWTVIMDGGRYDGQVTPQQVCLMMIWLKMCREIETHSRDNLVDIAGYTALLEKLTEQK